MINILGTRCTRISPGIYDLAVFTRVGSDQASDATVLFDVERYPDGAWLLFQMHGDRREYMNDFRTKHAAIEAARAFVKENTK